MAAKAKAKSRAKSTAAKSKAAGKKGQPKRGAGRGNPRKTTTADDGVKVEKETGVVGARAMDQKEAVALNSRHVAVRNGSESVIGPDGDTPEPAEGGQEGATFEKAYKQLVGGEPGSLAKTLKAESEPKQQAVPKGATKAKREEIEQANAREAGSDQNERAAKAVAEKHASIAKRAQNMAASDLFALIGDGEITRTQNGVRVTRQVAGGFGVRGWEGRTIGEAVASMLIELETGPRQLGSR